MYVCLRGLWGGGGGVGGGGEGDAAENVWMGQECSL